MIPAAQLSPPPNAWTRENRLLAYALLASVGVHISAIALSPRLGREDVQPPRPLEVVIEKALPRAEPKPPPPPVAKPQPPKPTPRVVQREPRQKTPPPPVPEQRQVLAVPQPSPSTPSTFTVPQNTEPAPPAPDPKPVAAAPPAPPREAPPTTPPNFNAAYLRNAPPRYPLIARRNGVEGTVRLKVLVTKDGKPARVELERSSGSAALDNAALEAVRGWQFVPARRGQEPIESSVLVPIVFKLEGTS
jgi:protein TonB